MTTRVHIENTYTCGRITTADEEVEDPPDMHPERLETWWEEKVHDLTGDGHQAGEGGPGCRGGSREIAIYSATIDDCPAFPELVGESYEWEG